MRSPRQADMAVPDMRLVVMSLNLESGDVVAAELRNGHATLDELNDSVDDVYRMRPLFRRTFRRNQKISAGRG
jgi:hypothetical protein